MTSIQILSLIIASLLLWILHLKILIRYVVKGKSDQLLESVLKDIQVINT